MASQDARGSEWSLHARAGCPQLGRERRKKPTTCHGTSTMQLWIPTEWQSLPSATSPSLLPVGPLRSASPSPNHPLEHYNLVITFSQCRTKIWHPSHLLPAMLMFYVYKCSIRRSKQPRLLPPTRPSPALHWRRKWTPPTRMPPTPMLLTPALLMPTPPTRKPQMCTPPMRTPPTRTQERVEHGDGRGRGYLVPRAAVCEVAHLGELINNSNHSVIAILDLRQARHKVHEDFPLSICSAPLGDGAVPVVPSH